MQRNQVPGSPENTIKWCINPTGLSSTETGGDADVQGHMMAEWQQRNQQVAFM